MEKYADFGNSLPRMKAGEMLLDACSETKDLPN